MDHSTQGQERASQRKIGWKDLHHARVLQEARLPDFVFLDDDGKPKSRVSQRCLKAMLESIHSIGPTCWASAKEIGARKGFGERQVRRALQALAKMGIVECVERKRSRSSQFPILERRIIWQDLVRHCSDDICTRYGQVTIVPPAWQLGADPGCTGADPGCTGVLQTTGANGEDLTLRAKGTDRPVGQSPLEKSSRGEPLDLSEVDWGLVTAMFAKVSTIVRPCSDRDTRAWLRYAVMAQVQFSEHWLIDAASAVEHATDTRTTKQKHFVAVLKKKALELDPDCDKDNFNGIAKRIEIPTEIWKRFCKRRAATEARS